MSRVLVTGGSRSGKSGFAEERAARSARVVYLATGAVPDDSADPEWALRVARHHERRPTEWVTVETLDIVSQLSISDGSTLLVDGIGTWLAGTMDAVGFWSGPSSARAALDDAVAALVAAFACTTRSVIAVTDEVGSGVVPSTQAGRQFRDELGQLNVALARSADEVWLVTVGIGQQLR